MSDFEKWFKTTEAYKMLEEQNYFKMDLFFFVGARNQYRHSGVQVAYLTWQHQQAIIDSLKTQLNNMEQCYIQAKKELEDVIFLKDEHRKRRCQLARELTQKSLRLTDAEFEYKRIKGLQAKDCLQIMCLTARNEKLSHEIKTLRGEHE